jgi:TolA-binding protein
MAFSRRWFLIVLLLALSGGPLLAAREDRAFDAAAAAFHDGQYTAAAAKLTQYLQSYHKSEKAPEALLLLAQSEYYLKSYAPALSQLNDPTDLARARSAGLGDQYDYWRGEIQFAAGDATGAAETLVAVGKNHADSPLALRAVVEGAAIWARNADWARVNDLLENTNGLFQHRARTESTNQWVGHGRLLEAEAKCAQHDFGGAVQVLAGAKFAALAPEQDWQRARLLYRANSGVGDLEAALAATTNLIQIARAGQGSVWNTNLAESVACLAEALGALGRTTQAIGVWQLNLAANVPPDQQRQAVLKVADLALAQGDLAAAEAGLTGFLAGYPDSPASGIARLRLGELQLQQSLNQSEATNLLLLAHSNLDVVINADHGGPLAGKAYLDRGWCEWLVATNSLNLGDTNGARQWYTNSFNDFQSAVTKLPGDSADSAVAYFKRGDAEFALGRYGDAINSYRAVLGNFVGLTNVMGSLGARSLYQVLRAQLELHDTNGMSDSMSQLLGRFGNSGEATNGLLLAGQGLTDFGDPAKARALFERFSQERTDPHLMAQVSFARARTYAREGNWLATITNCETWLGQYPTNEAQPEVEYFRNLAVGQTGDETRAFGLFTNFVVRYETNAEVAPLAHGWLAGYYFRRGTNFVDAEREYEHIFVGFPNDPLAAQAQLMAAHAAIARASYLQAVNLYLTKLIDNTNAPGLLRDKARLAYAEAEVGLAADTDKQSLEKATTVLAEMFYETPTNILGALAWYATGKCDQQMEAFDAATNAFAQALAAPSASPELRCQARVGMGITLEKKADALAPDARRPLLALALQYYSDVIYTSDEVSDPTWIKEAAFRALPLMPLVEGDVNRFIDRLEYWLPQLKDKLEKKRTADGKK